MKAWKPPFFGDAVERFGDCSVEGMIGEKVGLSRCVSKNGLDAATVYSGDSAAELPESGDSAEGLIGATGKNAGEGDSVGEVEEVALARVSISIFMPWTQCPSDPHIKYLLPGEVRGMVVAPSL